MNRVTFFESDLKHARLSGTFDTGHQIISYNEKDNTFTITESKWNER